jgi:hypothetical protein
MKGMAQFLVFSTMLGAMSMWLKAYVNGRRIERPENPRDASRLFLAAFLQGGGAGLYGDFLIGQAKDRYGHSAFSALMGPTFGATEDAYSVMRKGMALPFDLMFDKMKAGEGAWGDIFFALKNNAPFINLFYTRMAVDYMFLYELQEYMAPGSLKRMEKSFKENQNQTFALPPSQKSNITDLTAQDVGTLLNPLSGQ